MRDDDAIAIAQRLNALGVEVRSPSLRARQAIIDDFAKNGNRALRRARARANRKRGS